MAETFNKKALKQKRAKKKQDKIEDRKERKANNNKGKGIDEMMAYLDEYGNITDVPPDKQKKISVSLESIQIGATPRDDNREYTGIVSLFFVDKGYGFIAEDNSGDSIFVHNNKIMEPITEKDKVIFEKERTHKGYAAINVRKIK